MSNDDDNVIFDDYDDDGNIYEMSYLKVKLTNEKIIVVVTLLVSDISLEVDYKKK